MTESPKFIPTNKDNQLPVLGIRSGEKVPKERTLFKRDRLLDLYKRGDATVIPLTLSKVKDMVREETGIQISQEADTQLNLGRPTGLWHMISHPDSLSLLFVGGITKDFSIEEGVAVIELTRSVDYSNINLYGDGYGGASATRDTVFPDAIAITSINKESNRVIHARYGVRKNALVHGQVSLRADELQEPLRHHVHAGFTNYGDSLTEIPIRDITNLSIDNIGAFITPRMAKAIEAKASLIRLLNISSHLSYGELLYKLGNNDTALAEAGYQISNADFMGMRDSFVLAHRRLNGEEIIIRPLLVVPTKLIRSFDPKLPYAQWTGR